MFTGKKIFDELRALRYCHSEHIRSAQRKLREGSAFCSGQAPRGNRAFRGGLEAGNDVRGFSLVEVLVAMTILSIGILGIMGLAGTGVNSGAFAINMTQATNLAQDRIEALQGVLFTTLQVTDTVTGRADLRRTCTGPTGPANRPVYTCAPSNPLTLGTKTFTWSYTVTFLDLDGNGVASESSDALKRLDVSVIWRDPIGHTDKTTTISTVVTK